MTPYRPTGERTFVIRIATGDPAQPYRNLRTETRDVAIAKRMAAMLDLLSEKGKRWLWIREGLLAKRVRLGAVYDHWVAGTLEALRAQLDDRDLAPLRDAWLAALEAAVRDGAFGDETLRKYRQQTALLLDPDGALWQSTLTAPQLKQRLELVPGSGTNRRRHAAAWSSCLEYCVERAALETNPLRLFRLPKSNRPKDRYAEWAHVVRLLHAMPPGLHQALAAVRHGAGIEMQAALAMRRADVDLETRVVWAHGKKNTHRDRQAIVLDDACWALFAPYVRTGGFLPDARLFAIDARVHAEAQHAACALLRAEGVPIREGYTLHAARHAFAVEMKKRGHEDSLIAANLGHANARLVQTLYGKFAPRAEDLIRSARRAQGGTP